LPCGLEIVTPRCFLILTFIRYKDVDAAERLIETTLPPVVRIVIGVQRYSKASIFYPADQLGNPRLQPTLQLKR